MKKCPFCDADLAENARFCLFCMASLEEKEVIAAKIKYKKRWWIVVAAVTLGLSLGLLIWWLCDGAAEPKVPAVNDEKATAETEKDAEETVTDNGENTVGSTVEIDPANPSAPPVTPSNGGVISNNGGGQDASVDNGGNTAKPVQGSSAGTGKDSVPDPPDQTTDTPKTPVQENPAETVTDPAPAEPPAKEEKAEQISWNYRQAGSGDYDIRYNKVEAKDAVVIIGFDNIPSNGIYKIPATIDGKAVVGINMLRPEGYCFADEAVAKGVRKVYLPPKLNKLQIKTFENCIHLTDLYVAGDFLLAYPEVFVPKEQRSDTLTLHSSLDAWCLLGSKTIAAYCSYQSNSYGAVYEEWDGSTLYGGN